MASRQQDPSGNYHITFRFAGTRFKRSLKTKLTRKAKAACARRAAAIARSVILAADLIVIPVQPSAVDVWATVKTIDLVREAEAFTPEIACCLAINRRVANTVIGRDVRKALKEIEVPVLKCDIGQRVVFAESTASGTTALAYKGAKAATEIRKFVNELRRLKK